MLRVDPDKHTNQTGRIVKTQDLIDWPRALGAKDFDSNHPTCSVKIDKGLAVQGDGANHRLIRNFEG